MKNKGEEQANEVGKFLKKFVEEKNIDLTKSTLWSSTYLRARQTSNIINKYLNIKDVKEDVALIEHQYGLFDNISDEDREKEFDKELKHYNKYHDNNGKFYVRFPQGESPMDVALRTRQFIETLFRDYNEGVENFFIVSHGTTIRAFLLSYFHYSPEWFNNEANMDNCSVRLILKDGKKNLDLDYIYGGRRRKNK